MVRLYGSANDEATRVDKFYCNVNNETREATKLYGATPQITSFSGSIVSGAGNIERLWAGGATFSAKLKSDFPEVWKRRDEIRYASVYCSGTNGGWFYINVFYADGTSVEVLNHGTVLFGLTEWGIIAYSTTSTNPGTDLINLTPIIRPCTKLIHQAVRHRDPMETQWGVAEYWTGTRIGYGTGSNTHNVNVAIDPTTTANQTNIANFVNDYNVKFTNHAAAIWYGSNDSWWFETTNGDWASVPTAVIQGQYFLYIYPNTQSDAEWEIMDNAVIGVDKTSPTAIAKVRNETEFNTLCPSSVAATATIDGQPVSLKAIKKFTFGTNPTVVPDRCLYYSDVETVDLKFATFTSIGNSFLYNCYYLNSPIVFPDGLTSIGNNFFYNNQSFNSDIVFPDTLTTIGNSFMYGCHGFNKPLHIDSVTSIGSYFLCSNAFNQPFKVPEGLTSLGSSFFSCINFNSTMDLSNVTTIGTYFMTGCRKFNQPLDVSKVTSVSTYFLHNCFEFNQPLNFASLTSLGAYPLYANKAFNQKLYMPLVTAIPNSFMWSCSAFNQDIDLTGVTTIGASFLVNTIAFQSTIKLSSSITSIGTAFMSAAQKSYTIDCGAPASVASSNNYTLSAYSNSVEAYTTGVKLTGTNASAWHSRFADRTSSPYRKTIVV